MSKIISRRFYRARAIATWIAARSRHELYELHSDTLSTDNVIVIVCICALLKCYTNSGRQYSYSTDRCFEVFTASAFTHTHTHTQALPHTYTRPHTHTHTQTHTHTEGVITIIRQRPVLICPLYNSVSCVHQTKFVHCIRAGLEKPWYKILGDANSVCRGSFQLLNLSRWFSLVQSPTIAPAIADVLQNHKFKLQSLKVWQTTYK